MSNETECNHEFIIGKPGCLNCGITREQAEQRQNDNRTPGQKLDAVFEELNDVVKNAQRREDADAKKYK